MAVKFKITNRDRVQFIICILVTAVPVAISALDEFYFGVAYPDSSSRLILLPNQFTELCEGESGKLQCPGDKVIKLARHNLIQFGRNTEWETRTRCKESETEPQADVSSCTAIPAKRLLSSCNGLQRCNVELRGKFKEKDPCPGQGGPTNSRPRKYLVFKYSCVLLVKSERIVFKDEEDEENETSYLDGEDGTGDDSDYAQLASPDSERFVSYMEGQADDIVKKIQEAGEITDFLKESVTNYLESMMQSMKINSRFYKKLPISTLNMTERISSELMNLLDIEEEATELEIKTSQMTLKLVKRKFTEGDTSATKWTDRNSAVILPNQEEIARTDTNEIEITLASYENLQEELSSASDVITVSVNKQTPLSKPVTFLLSNNGTQNVSCAYWSFLSDHWAKDGCVTVCHNITHTKCSCNHLTNFALIFNVHEEFVGDMGIHSTRLTYITYIGFSISILCMVLTVILFVSQLRSKPTERDVIHVNLCISLLTAELIFLFGIEQTQDVYLCTGVAVILHYFFLASFSWMLLEGYQIYVMLVMVFDTRSASRSMNFLVGYGIPLAVVLASFTLDHIRSAPSREDMEDMCWRESQYSSYGTEQYCWLRVDNHFILSFILPAVMVIFSNLGFLVFAIYSMFLHKLSGGTNRKQVVSYMKGVGVLMCLLGSTWISGLLYLAINSIYLAYAFTILNSLQGVGIFIFQCLLNPSVKLKTRSLVHRHWASLGLGDRTGTYKKAGQSSAPGEKTGHQLSGQSTTPGERKGHQLSGETLEDDCERTAPLAPQAVVMQDEQDVEIPLMEVKEEDKHAQDAEEGEEGDVQRRPKRIEQYRLTTTDITK